MEMERDAETKSRWHNFITELVSVKKKKEKRKNKYRRSEFAYHLSRQQLATRNLSWKSRNSQRAEIETFQKQLLEFQVKTFGFSPFFLGQLFFAHTHIRFIFLGFVVCVCVSVL